MPLPPINPQSFELSLEQQLKLKIILDSIQDYSKQELIDTIYWLLRQLEVKNNLYKELLKHF